MTRLLINARKGHRGFYAVPLEQRFWEKVAVGGRHDCWGWLAGKDEKGYGHFFVQGRDTRAHRVAWELSNGRPFPEGKLACHSCDNPGCINPEHIWPGTYQDNNRDAAAKRRYPGQSKTHCPQGHAYSEENTIRNERGHRQCLTCRTSRNIAAGIARRRREKEHASA